jgi:hypothetical protein
MCMGGSAPSMPAPPPPPVPYEETAEGKAAMALRQKELEEKETAEAEEARKKVLAREAAMQGRKATILTGGQGDTSQASVQRKTLLGR